MDPNDATPLFLSVVAAVAFLFFARIREYVYAAAAAVALLLSLFVLIGPSFINLDRPDGLDALIMAPLVVLAILLGVLVKAKYYKDIWRQYKRRNRH